MRSKVFLPAIALALPAAVPAADLRTVCADLPRYYVETVAETGHAYTVRMSGRIDGEMTRDPVGYWAYDQYWEPNVFVKLENVGDLPVVNPWLRRADRPDTRSLRALVDWIVDGSTADAEKARRLWEWEIKHRFHATTEDDEVKDVVKMVNCYGYTLCYDESLVMSDLWRAAGLPVRRGFPNGHSTAEAFYDRAWHLLDSDESIICLLPDNRTIAGEAEIVADHWLMKRTHTYGPLHDDDLNRDETSSALHYWEGERSGEHPSRTRHQMKFTLRPGESLTWAWNPGKKFHGKAYQDSQTQSYYWNKRWRLIANIMNGELAWDCDLLREPVRKEVRIAGLALRENGPYGRGLYLDADSASVVLPVESAYPVVGGSLEVEFARRNLDTDRLRVWISYDDGASWREVWTTAGSEYVKSYIDLDEFFPIYDPARYKYLLRFDLVGAAGQEFCIKGAFVRSTLQMARLALPGVSLGDNRFVYSDKSPAGRRVRITHAWRECSAAEVPGKPPAAVYPPDRGAADGTRIAFRWQPPVRGAKAEDYEFQLSEFEDFRWTLSPNFHKLVSKTLSRGTASLALPWPGLLNPDCPYFWRVRARSSQGVWGSWSETFSFRIAAPAVPVSVQAHFDPASRSARLSWQPGALGTSPVRYRIYGSAERGFAPSDTAYRYDAGLDGMKSSPPNLLCETAGPATELELPAQLWRPWLRVAAVDAEGRESGVSTQAELAHPLITTAELPAGVCSTLYRARVEVSSSIGHLVSLDENGKAYQMRFRSGDSLLFQLAGAPESVRIDPHSGLISGYLPAGSAGEYGLTVKVRDLARVFEDEKKLVLRVVEAAPSGLK